jgi:hypothetical protein
LQLKKVEMSCIKTFDDNGTTGLFSGGPWSNNGIVEYVGYSTVSTGPFGAGGNWPWATNVWGASIDTTGINEGFYQLKYKSTLSPGDPCYGEVVFVIAIAQGTGAAPATPVEISMCSTDVIRNIFNDSGLFAAAAVNPILQSLSGAGISSPGYSAGNAGINDDSYDPSQEVSYPAIVQFDITYTPQPPAGFTLDGCTNCDPVTISVIYTVTESFEIGTVTPVAVCNDGDI